MDIIEDVAVPVVDFSVFSLDRPEKPTDEELAPVVSSIEAALKQCNAFWIENCGISQAEVSTST